MYTPQYDLSKVTPFEIDSTQHTKLEQFSRLVAGGHLNEVAYWFTQKNNGVKGFRYCYEDGIEYPYEMKDFLPRALEVAINQNQKDIVNFLLFDELVKDRHCFRGRKITKWDESFSWSVIHFYQDVHDPQKNALAKLCLENQVFGFPMEVSSGLKPILKNVIETSDLKYMLELQHCLDLEPDTQKHKPRSRADQEKIKKGVLAQMKTDHPNEFEIYEYCENFKNAFVTKKKDQQITRAGKQRRAVG